MASTERTRSISGSSAAGLDDIVTEHHNHHHNSHHHHQHHHQHHSQHHSQHPQHHQQHQLHHNPQHHQQHQQQPQDFGGSGFGNLNLFQNFASSVGDANSSSAMNLSQISAHSSASESASTAMGGGGRIGGLSITHNISGSYCRFPKLEECAHFHYERVQLGQILLRLVEDRSDLQSSSNASQHDAQPTQAGPSVAATAPAVAAAFANAASNVWFIIRVTAEKSDPFLIRRSLENIRMLDEMLHRCVYDRKISGLKDFQEFDSTAVENLQLENLVAAYLNRFSNIMTDSLTCGPVLTWFQLDNKGRRLPLADMDTMKSINTPAVGAAYGIRKYTAQAVDEISIEVGDMISVIDMPSPAESTWWRGKKSHLQKSHYEVGFFPQTCVATIGDKVPRNLVLPAPLVGSLAVSPTKPVLRKHGKLIAFFRSFILSRPSRRRLKQSGIYKERVFSCDLSEHLLNSGQEIPMVLRCCAEFIEESGIVDGIYRLSGITSNIQKLRRSFDEERIPDFSLPDVRQDIHAMSSLLKMYFRELPNPLCTFQLYDNFVDAIQTRGDAAERLRLMKETVQKLPPPHYRTLKYLAKHLNKISHHHKSTGMTDRNLAIVWAPNLLRSPALETGDDYISGVAALRGVGVQAVVTEYLITNCTLIFDSAEDYDRYESLQYDSLTDTESLQLEQRDHHDHSLFIERPKSLSVGGPKLISLEEAQTRRGAADGGASAASAASAQHKSAAVATPGSGAAAAAGAAGAGATTNCSSSYIEVGGGPSSLPDKYHTVLPVPRSWSKRKTNSWKSLFTRNQQRGSATAVAAAGAGGAGKKGVPIISHPHALDADAAATAATVAAAMAAAAAAAIDRGGAHTTHISLRNGHDQLAAAKSIDLFEAGSVGGGGGGGAGSGGKQPMDVCLMRSASIDSLRTVGHSRSVSHDSYFDLLQSPLRSGAAGTCLSGGGAEQLAGTAAITASRELSELGLNFDREEPEMRIFSESESLVSSPRVAKDVSRRSTRSRPDDHHTYPQPGNGHSNNHGNSHNPSNNHGNQPSPKKQPRLNIPNTGTNLTDLQWCSSASNTSVAHSIGNASAGCGGQHDESSSSMCKRYKLEDQLSDIQYIDCGTPEHCAAQPKLQHSAAAVARSPIYASVQIHQPPADHSRPSSVRSSNGSIALAAAAATGGAFQSASDGAVRYSYPGLKSRNFSPDAGAQRAALREERFSYPGMGRKFTHNEAAAAAQQPARPLPAKLMGRFSYCDPATAAAALAAVSSSSSTDAMARSSFADSPARAAAGSKLSLPTPSTPGHSPRYSLLVGDTSSECSSAVCTPVFDMDVSQFGMLLPPQSRSAAGSSVAATPSPTPLSSALPARPHNAMTSSCPTPPTARDIAQIKRELSLDLDNTTSGGSSKMSVDCDVAGRQQQQQQQQQQHGSTPDTPNAGTETETSGGGNTSQSVTPSEFGYHHLSASRQSNVVSPAVSLSSPSALERSFGSALKAASKHQSSQPQPLLASPIRSTINITYNLRSPGKFSAPTAATHENVFFCSGTASTPTSASSTLTAGRAPRTSDTSADYELVSVVTVEAQPMAENEAEAAAAAAEADEFKKPLLETSFDENMVYEQVKFFKGAISAVNSMLSTAAADNGNLPIATTQRSVDSSMEAECCSDYNDPLEQHVVPQLVSESSAGDEPSESLDDRTAGTGTSTAQTSGVGCGLGAGGLGGGADNSQESTDADVPMHDQELLDDIPDSLELDANVSMYENVELRRPDSVYENVDVRRQTTTTTSAAAAALPIARTVASTTLHRPSTFNVRQLANKFEATSPVSEGAATQSSAHGFGTTTMAFDFAKPFGRRLDTNRNASFGAAINRASMTAASGAGAAAAAAAAAKSGPYAGHILHGSAKHTRSLDENAFVREFGTHRLLASSGVVLDALTQSVLAIDSATATAAAPGQQTAVATPPTAPDTIDGRRLSLEFTRPKTLNPPKRLPELSSRCGGGEQLEELCKSDGGVLRHKFERITPTTENPISLIQHNVANSHGHGQTSGAMCRDSLELAVAPQSIGPDEATTGSAVAAAIAVGQQQQQPNSGAKVLGTCKLDRERIEKIKEERRLQLNEKFRGTSAENAGSTGGDVTTTATTATAVSNNAGKSKSKSRCELRDLRDMDAALGGGGVELRYKSKSRGDVRSSGLLRDSRESLAQLSSATMTTMTRVRRISDERNQNDCVGFGATGTGTGTTTGDLLDSAVKSVSNKARKFDGPKTGGGGGGVGGVGFVMTTATATAGSRLSMGSQRERISPQFNIRDVAAMFESRSQQ